MQGSICHPSLPKVESSEKPFGKREQGEGWARGLSRYGAGRLAVRPGKQKSNGLIAGKQRGKITLGCRGGRKISVKLGRRHRELGLLFLLPVKKRQSP